MLGISLLGLEPPVVVAIGTPHLAFEVGINLRREVASASLCHHPAFVSDLEVAAVHFSQPLDCESVHDDEQITIRVCCSSSHFRVEELHYGAYSSMLPRLETTPEQRFSLSWWKPLGAVLQRLEGLTKPLLNLIDSDTDGRGTCVNALTADQQLQIRGTAARLRTRGRDLLTCCSRRRNLRPIIGARSTALQSEAVNVDGRRIPFLLRGSDDSRRRRPKGCHSLTRCSGGSRTSLGLGLGGSCPRTCWSTILRGSGVHRSWRWRRWSDNIRRVLNIDIAFHSIISFAICRTMSGLSTSCTCMEPARAR